MIEMIRYIILLICVCAVLSQFKRGKPRRKSAKPRWDCKDIEDGLYIGDCLNFYRCKNETTEHLPCPGNLVVNERQMWCDYKDLVPPPCGTAPNCTGIIDGNYPDYNRKCQYYYTCLHDDFYGYTKCAANLLFNSEKNNCDWPFLVKPPCGDAAESVYPVKPDRVG